MWIKRKQKNRRLGREYVLDVKLRSSQVRATRLRMAAVGFGMVLAVVLGVYGLWRAGAWALDRLLYENKAFAIEEMDAQTDGVMAVDQLRRWAGVRLGENLLRLDLARVKRDLELISVVRPPASVERVLPHTLRIRITEREPVAQINLPQPRTNGRIEMVLFQLDADGYVMLPLEPAQRATAPPEPPEEFPLLRGLSGNQTQVGRRVESPQVQAALQLIAAFGRAPLSEQVDIRCVDVSAPEVLVVTTGQGSTITFGLSDLESQLRRWQQIFERGQKASKAIATLDLAITNYVPATWLEASAVPPATPKPKPPRKKHV